VEVGQVGGGLLLRLGLRRAGLVGESRAGQVRGVEGVLTGSAVKILVRSRLLVTLAKKRSQVRDYLGYSACLRLEPVERLVS